MNKQKLQKSLGLAAFVLLAAGASISNAAGKSPTPEMMMLNYTTKADIILATMNFEIKGRVTDERGLPIPGVNVKVKDSQLGTSTNTDGYCGSKV